MNWQRDKYKRLKKEPCPQPCSESQSNLKTAGRHLFQQELLETLHCKVSNSSVNGMGVYKSISWVSLAYLKSGLYITQEFLVTTLPLLLSSSLTFSNRHTENAAS